MLEKQQQFREFAEALISPLCGSEALPVITSPQDLPLDRLEWKAFEQLCCRLVARMQMVEGEPYLYGLPGQAQRGIDIVAHVKRGEHSERWGFQCRRVQRMTPSALKRAVDELDYIADHFVVLTASPAGTALQDTAEALETVELWDARVLSDKLKAHPDLVADFFGPHWAAYFGGQVGEGKYAVLGGVPEEEVNWSGVFGIPRSDPGFVGREPELDELTAYLRHVRSIAIEGPGGIGKTQLLIKALEMMSSDDERETIWINGEAFSRMEDVELALTAALRQIGFSVPTGQYLQALQDASVRVVLDGIERAISSGDEVADLLHTLLTLTRGPQFVFTSQVDLSLLRPEVQIRVEPLRVDEASALLIRQGKFAGSEQAEREFLRELLAFAEGHPLTLHLVAAHLRRYGTAADVLKRLHKEGPQLLRTPGRRHQTRRTSLELALALAYEALTKLQRRTLQCLAHFPGGGIDRIVEMVVGGVAKEAGEGEVDVLDDLGELHRWHLVQRRAEGQMLRYRLLEPIRAFILAEAQREQAAEMGAIRYEIARNFGVWAMIKKYRYLQMSGGAESTGYGLMRFDSEFTNYLAAIEYVKEDLENAGPEERQKLNTAIHFLVAGLTTYLFVRGFLERGVDLLRLGISAGREVGFSCAELFLMLVRIQGRMRDRSGIRETTEAFREALGEMDDPEAEANYLVACADAAEMDHDYEEAERLYRKAELAYQRLQPDSEEEVNLDDSQAAESLDLGNGVPPPGRYFAAGMRALAIAQQARMRENLGDFTAALALGQKALQLLYECGDGINPPSTLFHIARAHEGLGNLEQALEAYVEATGSFFEMGTSQNLSNSVAEIASLLTTHEHLQQPTFPIELIDAALNDVAVEAKQAANIPGEAAWTWGGNVTWKAFSIMALASYAAHADGLHQWGLWLREQVVIPYFETKPPLAEPSKLADVIVRELDLIAVIALTVAELLAVGELPEEALKRVATLCRELVAFNYDPFLWLAKWVRMFQPERNDVAPAELRQMASGVNPYRE